jgi:hypothetical protein
LLASPLAAIAAVAAVLAGVVGFPILLPYLPTREFSSKGFLLGIAVALPFAAIALAQHPGTPGWQRAGWALAYPLTMPPVTAFLALNFTGSTTFTSRSGVRQEIFRYVPLMAGAFGLGLALIVALAVIGQLGGGS